MNPDSTANPFDEHTRMWADEIIPQSETRKRLTLQPPKDYTIGKRMDDVRSEIIALGELLEDEVPAGRELSLALTNLEQVCFWAIGGIARNQGNA